MEIDARIDELLANLKPITLDEMKEIRLMNRTDVWEIICATDADREGLS